MDILPHQADVPGVAQVGHLTDDTTVGEYEGWIFNVLDLLMDISSLMGAISSHLEATEHYIQAEEH